MYVPSFSVVFSADFRLLVVDFATRFPTRPPMFFKADRKSDRSVPPLTDAPVFSAALPGSGVHFFSYSPFPLLLKDPSCSLRVIFPSFLASLFLGE